MHLSREARAAKAEKNRIDPDIIASVVYVAGRDLDGPLKISVSDNPVESLSREKLGFFAARIATPGDARRLFSAVRDKLQEFDLALGGNLFDVNAADAAALIDKLSQLNSIPAHTPMAFHWMARDASQGSLFSRPTPFWGCDDPEVIGYMAHWAEQMHEVTHGTTEIRALHRM